MSDGKRERNCLNFSTHTHTHIHIRKTNNKIVKNMRIFHFYIIKIAFGQALSIAQINKNNMLQTAAFVL